MKSMIETSLWCLLITISCFIFIEFISMNRNVSKVNEVTTYIQDYMEVHGSGTGNATSGYAIDSATLTTIDEIVKKYGMTFAYSFDAETNHYIYYKIQVGYNLNMPIFQLNKQHTYDAFARTCKTA